MTTPFRTPEGGRIDRATTLEFTFDGQRLTGHPGDTLASALLASGEPHPTVAPFSLDRFVTGALVDEHGAAAVAH